MHITNERLDKIFGSGAAREAPTTAVGSVVEKIAKLDADVMQLAEENRQPDESQATAYARLLAEKPEIYDRHVARKAEIMREHGFSDGVE